MNREKNKQMALEMLKEPAKYVEGELPFWGRKPPSVQDVDPRRFLQKQINVFDMQFYPVSGGQTTEKSFETMDKILEIARKAGKKVLYSGEDSLRMGRLC